MRTTNMQSTCGNNGESNVTLSPNPEWLRVSEACAYCRVSKPKMYDLLNRGLVKSVSLKERGQIKGTRLVSFHSLKAFLESKATGGIES